MLKLIDLMNNNNVVKFNSLNDAVIESIKATIDGCDESQRAFLQYYLDNPCELDNMTVKRKIKEIELNNYSLYNKENIKEARIANNCQVCGDIGVKAYIYTDEKCNELSVCTACLGIEDRNSTYRHSRESITKIFKELESLTKDIHNVKDFVSFAKENKNHPDFEGFEIDGVSAVIIDLNEIDEDFKADTLRFGYKTIYAYLDTDTFTLDKEISVWDSEGGFVSDWVNYDEFNYNFHRAIRL